jgi:hypothetical protein
MWGRCDRVIITSGLSKAYGLPGLRIGWVVGPPTIAAGLWTYHDYTTIAPGALSDALARRALEPARRTAILARTRGILNQNFPIIARWLDGHGASSALPERARSCKRAITTINSTTRHLRQEKASSSCPAIASAGRPPSHRFWRRRIHPCRPRSRCRAHADLGLRNWRCS